METKEEQLIGQFRSILQQLIEMQSGKKTARDRAIAVCYNLLQQAYAYFLVWVLDYYDTGDSK